MIKYLHHSYEAGNSQQEFLNFCKNYKLHNAIIDNNSSRLHSIYTKNEICTGIEAVIAEHNEEPIAIAFVEHRDNKFIEITNQDTGEKRIAYNLGRIHFFVKEEYRHQGISKTLSTNIEEHCLLKMMISHNETRDFIPFFVAQEKALHIINKNSKWTYGTEFDGPNLARKRQFERIIKGNDVIYNKTTFSDFFDKNHMNAYFHINTSKIDKKEEKFE